jgi:hypothetical protein
MSKAMERIMYTISPQRSSKQTSESNSRTNIEGGIRRNNDETNNREIEQNKDQACERNNCELNWNLILDYVTAEQRRLTEEVMRRVAAQLEIIQSNQTRHPQAQSTPHSPANLPQEDNPVRETQP